MAREINVATQVMYTRAVRIARTEGGRVSALATDKGYEEAASKGIDMKIMWLASLDSRTRDTHRHMDGKKRAMDGYFSVGGRKAKAPHLVGVAAEDINCRCTTRAIIDGINPTVRRDGDGEMSTWETYDQWEKRKGTEAELKKLINNKKILDDAKTKSSRTEYRKINPDKLVDSSDKWYNSLSVREEDAFKGYTRPTHDHEMKDGSGTASVSYDELNRQLRSGKVDETYSEWSNEISQALRNTSSMRTSWLTVL